MLLYYLKQKYILLFIKGENQMSDAWKTLTLHESSLWNINVPDVLFPCEILIFPLIDRAPEE